MISVGGVPVIGGRTVAAGRALLTQLVGAALGVALDLREACMVDLGCTSLSDTPLSEALAGAFVYSGGTLTAPVDGDLRDLTGIPFELGTRFLWRLLTDDRPRTGVYVLTGFGGVSSRAVWTRAADFDASADFIEGAAVLAAGEGGAWTLYRSTAAQDFVLDTDPVVFEVLNPAWIVAAGSA